MARHGQGQEDWWRATAILAGAVIVAVGGLAILSVLLSRWEAASLFLGLPFPLFLLVFGVPVLGLAAIFWFARRQNELDHRYDVTGD